MNERIKQAQISLEFIQKQITGMITIPKMRDGWSGAGVVLTVSSPKATVHSSFYGSRRTVITPFAMEATWLLLQLKEVFNGLIDHCSKYEFYGRIANVAERYHRHLDREPETAKDLLIVMLNEAKHILDEMQSGRFEYLTIAVGNTIADDLPSLYFAYGSNMDIKRMSDRCPGAKLVGKAILEGYRFITNTRGVATIIPDSMKSVNGLVWLISREDEYCLDDYEGVKFKTYLKEYVSVYMEMVSTENVLVYVASDTKPGKPRPCYLEPIIAACNQFFSEDYTKEIESWRI